MPNPSPRQIVAGTNAKERVEDEYRQIHEYAPDEEIVSRIHTAMLAAAWEPIESASKHGGLIVGVQGGLVASVVWRDSHQAWVTPTETGWQRIIDPTHWALLDPPPPPKAIEEE